MAFPQDAHERLLIERLNALGVHVERQTEFIQFQEHTGGIRATLRHSSGAEELCDAAYLAGCEALRLRCENCSQSGSLAEPTRVCSMWRVRLVGPVLQPSAGERPLDFKDVRGRAIDHLRLEVVKVNWLLAAVLKRNAADSLLDTYEPARIAFARRLVATTDRVFTILTKRGRVARLVRTRVAPRLTPLLFQFSPLRRFVFRTVSQIGVNYRTSPLSAGGIGGVRGGDRLPWVRIGTERDNFEPLASLNWQAHVYGRPRSHLKDGCGRLRLRFTFSSGNREMRDVGLRFGVLYLVRPDGYIALMDPLADPERLSQYFAERGLTPLSPDERTE